MKRPLLYILIFYILGILIEQYIVNKAFIVLFFTFTGIGIPFLYRLYKWKGVFIFPIFLVLGFVFVNTATSPVSNFIEIVAQNEQSVKISGRVTKIDYTSTGRQKVIVKTNYITIDNQQFDEKLNIQAILDLNTEVEYNQMILIEGNLQCFNFVRNPGGFDENLYMLTRRIDYKMFAKLLSTGNTLKNFDSYIYKIHQNLNYVYDNILPQKEASVLRAMLLGDKQNLDSSIKEIYRKSGISHILAISGLHISILSSILWLILNSLKFNKRLASALVLVVLSLYCIFTGSSISTVRAVTMIGIVLIGTIIYREADIFTSIATSALVLLIYQPLYLYDSGFQLSFGAVTGIILLTPVLERIQHIPKSIKPYLMSTLAATFATYPIIAFHFNTVSIVGLIVNILVLPLVAIVVGFGLLAGLMGLIWLPAGKFICGIVYFVLVLYEKICTIGANTAFSEIVTGSPSIIVILAYYSVILITVYYYYNTKQKRLKLKKYIVASNMFFLILGLAVLFKPKIFELVYLDVNQGDSVVIHTKDNKNMLIDGGGNIKKEVGETNTGSQIILPYLKYKGITSLDCVFVSHPDGDHILGIIELTDYIDIKQIVVADIPDIYNNQLFMSLEQKAQEHSIPIIKMTESNSINLKNDLTIQCIYPSKDSYIDSEDWNNGSLVMYMKYGKRTFIFTGDIEKEAEAEIANRYKQLSGDILKAPHHGSKTSSTQKFLDIAKPSIVIISSGKNNSYGHPHKEVLDRYKALNSRVYNTANDGAIIVTSDGDRLSISTMKEKKR